MVSNSSTFSEDLAWLGDELHELGQLTGVGPQDVIPGDPATVAEIGEHLTELGAALERAGRGIRAIDSGGWTGRAADAFRDAFLEKAPREWIEAGDALTGAGRAVLDYHEVLATEKPRAQRAKEELDRANAASQAALQAHRAATAAHAGGSGPAPGEFVDPGAEARARAEQEIAAARAAVRAAGDRAADTVALATADAPDAPGPLAQIAANAADVVQLFGDLAVDLGRGVVDGVVGTVQGVAGLGIGLAEAHYYSLPSTQLTDPEGCARFTEAATTAVQSVLENPWQAVKTVVDVDAWKENPARALGSMVPDAAASLVGGGIASRVAGTADRLADVADTAGDVSRTADRLGDAGHPAPRWDTGSPPRPGAPADPYARWDGPEFGPRGSDPLPEPEPPPAEPRSRELPEWFDDDGTPESWLDDGRGAPPPPDPAPELPGDPPAPDAPGPLTSAEDLARRASIEDEARTYESWAERGNPSDLQEVRHRAAEMHRVEEGAR